MKYEQRNPIRILTTAGAMLLSSMLLASCGGGSAANAIINAGIGGTGIVFGTITGFGSVWVNGRRFEIDDSEILVDGEAGSQGDLRIGMVVRLDVDTEDGMFAGSALRVEFDDEIEGPINGAPVEDGGPGSGVKRFEILDQEIIVDATRTLFAGTSYTAIAANDIVEISGFRVDDDRIVATYVEKVGVLGLPNSNPQVELRGKLSDLVAGVSFKINDVQIAYAGAIVDVDGGQLAEGMFVEVEGIFVSHTAVNALEVEQKNEAFGDDVDEISLQGIVSQFDSGGAGLADFLVGGQRVDASTAELDPEDLASLMQNGLEVEVEGEIIAGVLIAEELELRADSELRTTVFSVDQGNNSFVVEFPFVGNVTVNTSAQTLFEDDTAAAVPNFSLADLAPGDFVEVEGFEVGNAVSALTVERRDPNDTKLQGPVDAFDPGVSITILGISYPVDPFASYQENSITASAFFAGLRVNDIVELEDDEPDGDADEVEIDD